MNCCCGEISCVGREPRQKRSFILFSQGPLTVYWMYMKMSILWLQDMDKSTKSTIDLTQDGKRVIL